VKNFSTSLFSAAILACLLSSGCAVVPSNRQTINLNGTWQVAQGSLKSMPKAFEHTVPVPGLLDMASPAFKSPGSTLTPAQQALPWERTYRVDPLREAFWYRRTFSVDYPQADVVMLKVHKACFGAMVFVNGRKVGSHAHNFTPGWFNVKPFIKTDGSDNELIIRVGASLAQVPSSVCDGWDYEKNRYIPGIYDSVELIVSKTPHIVNLQTAADLDAQLVRVTAEVSNGGQVPVGATIMATVREVRSRRIVGRSIGTIDGMLPGVTAKCNATVPIKNPRWWTPEDPFLYELTVDTGADTCKTRFAMRTFKSDPASGKMLLNGKPYFLRGTNVCINRFFEDPKRRAKPWDRQWVRKLHRKFKGMHWNSLRYRTGFPPEMWYEIADEEGFLIQDEFPISYGGWKSGTMDGWPDQILATDLIREFTEWMRERWNHPSVVIWDAQNETPNDTVIAAAIGKVRKMDLSNRPWDNGWGSPQAPGDMSEHHPYRCSPKPPRAFKLSRFEKETGLPNAGPKKGARPPYIINEYGGLWLDRNGKPTTLSKPVYHSIFGSKATPAQLSEYYARTVAAQTEFWRSKRKCAGVMHFCGLGYSRKGGQTSDNFTDLNELTFNADFEHYVRDAFSPVSVVIDMWKERIDPGKLLQIRVKVINDLEADWRGTVTLRMVDSNGKAVLEGGSRVLVKGFASDSADFKVQFPDKISQCQLIAEIQGPDGQSVRSYRKLQIAPPPKKKPAAKPRPKKRPAKRKR
jgi:beta-galactosidase